MFCNRLFCLIWLSMSIIFIIFTADMVASENVGHKRAGNYHWATKILGGNDKNDTHPGNVHVVLEIGSRDLMDGNYLAWFYGAQVYSFEANPFNHPTMEANHVDPNVHIVRSAVAKHDGTIKFMAVNTSEYGNAGIGSLHEADYLTNRSPNDPDYNRTSPLFPVVANSTRLDTFIRTTLHGRVPEMICLDCQESELEAIQSAGELLRKVSYIIFEAASVPGYKGGNSYRDMHEYLDSMGFGFLALRKMAGRSGHIRFKRPENGIIDSNDSGDFVYVNRNLGIL